VLLHLSCQQLAGKISIEPLAYLVTGSGSIASVDDPADSTFLNFFDECLPLLPGFFGNFFLSVSVVKNIPYPIDGIDQ
jgi:hypothetical protein